jgi:hypothetical protein
MLMSETHYHIDRDLQEAREMAQGLEDYVRGENLYGTVSGLYASDPDMPSLTVGNLLLRLRRLQALQAEMSPEQRAILTEAEAEHERVRREWMNHYIGKATNEAGARLRSMEAFFAECEDAPETCAANYLPEALRRTVIQELVDGLNTANLPDSGLDKSLKNVDAQLRRFVESSSFLWDERLRPVYPQSRYWWLYERPTGKPTV